MLKNMTGVPYYKPCHFAEWGISCIDHRKSCLFLVSCVTLKIHSSFSTILFSLNIFTKTTNELDTISSDQL